MYVRLRDVIKDFLKEHNLTLNDVLEAMDESREGAIEALKRRTHLNIKQIKFLVDSLSSKQVNLLLFVIQTFYIANPSGLYRGKLIIPRRDDVITNGKATVSGLRLIMKELGIRPQWARVI